MGLIGELHNKGRYMFEQNKKIMSKEEAINLLRQVCEQFRGTYAEHILLQQALQVVSSLEPKKE